MTPQPAARSVAGKAVVTLVALALLLFAGAAIPTAPSAAAAPIVAQMGSRGSTVVTVQRVVHVTANGAFGSTTVAAVKVFQRAHHLAATGVVDAITWAQIYATFLRLPALGNDVSWPQCPKGTGSASRPGYGLAMPQASAQFVMIGLTDGPAFYRNQCLAGQTSWAKTQHAYAAAYSMTTFPTSRQLATYGTSGPYSAATYPGKLANAGFAQARFNVASMRAAGLSSPIVWVDVESYAVAPWTSDKAANKAVVDGVVRGYTMAGYKVGFYSTPYMWATVVGTTRYLLPEWRTAGARGQSVAIARCAGASSFQGGAAVLSQWWAASVDHDITCPSANTTRLLGTYFHKY